MRPKYTLVYWSYHVEYRADYESIEECVRAAAGGLDGGVLSPESVLDARGNVVMNKAGLDWAVSKRYDEWDRQAAERVNG